MAVADHYLDQLPVEEAGHGLHAIVGADVAHHLVFLERGADGLGFGNLAIDGDLPDQLSAGGGGHRTERRVVLHADGGVLLRVVSRRAGGDLSAVQGFLLGGGELAVEVLLRTAFLVLHVLLLVHGQFEKLFLVLADVPALLLHHLAVFRQLVGVVVLRHAVEEGEPFRLGHLNDFGGERSGQLSAFAEDHVPLFLFHIGEARLALHLGAHVHQRDVLDVLAERGHQSWGAHHRPDILHLLEELHEQLVLGEGLFAGFFERFVDVLVDALHVGHHGPHHASGQTAAEQQRCGDLVLGFDEEAEEVVHELLGEAAGLHVGVHVDVGDLEAVVAEHGLHGDDVGVDHAPGEGFHGYVDDVGAVAADLEDGGHREAGAGVSVVLDDEVRVFLLNGFHQLAKRCGASDAGHVFEADLFRAVLHVFVHHGEIVLEGMDRGVRDAEGGLRDEAELVGVFDGEFQVPVVVEAAEGAHDVHALGFLDFAHESAHVGGHGVHAQSVEGALQHLALDAGLAQRARPFAHSVVGVLAVQQVHLLEGATVGLHSVETAHPHDHGGDFGELVHSGLVLAGRLPHVAVHQTEFDSLLHTISFLDIGKSII